MKTDAIIQARMGSSRCPGKVLEPIAGRPLLEFLIDRLKHAASLDEIVVATTEREEDDAIAQVADAIGIRVVRGNEHDVLGRYIQAATEADTDLIVRVCADNPFTDPRLIDRAVDVFHDSDADHVSMFAEPTYPYGVGCAVFATETLRRIGATTDDPADREHVEPPLLRADDVKTIHLRAPPALDRPEIHVSVDEPFELQRAARIAERIVNRHGIMFSTEDLIEELDEAPLVVFVNGSLGLRCLRFLTERGEQIRGLVIHPPHEATLRDEIIEASGLCAEDIISPDNLDDPWIAQWIRDRSPELICTFWSSFIFPPEIIAIPPRGVVNLHNSLLPWCRGSGANIWTILERPPAGVTVHYITSEVDKGDVIAQDRVATYSWDTGKSLFLRLEEALFNLFCREWPSIRVGPVRTVPQEGKGTFHFRKEADALREIDLDETFTARELLDRLRAFTFPGYEPCYFIDEDGNKVFVSVELNRGITTVRRRSRSDGAPHAEERTLNAE